MLAFSFLPDALPSFFFFPAPPSSLLFLLLPPFYFHRYYNRYYFRTAAAARSCERERERSEQARRWSRTDVGRQSGKEDDLGGRRRRRGRSNGGNRRGIYACIAMHHPSFARESKGHRGVRYLSLLCLRAPKNSSRDRIPPPGMKCLEKRTYASPTNLYVRAEGFECKFSFGSHLFPVANGTTPLSRRINWSKKISQYDLVLHATQNST